MRKIDWKYKVLISLVSVGIVLTCLFLSFQYRWNVSFILRDIIYFPLRLAPLENNNQIILTNHEKELTMELAELKALMDIDEVLSDFTSVNATVINRNTFYWHNEVIINKGKNDGITENMAVIDGHGLVGKISKVSLTTATIEMINGNQPDNKISVKIWLKDRVINKILSTEQNNKLVITGIANDLDINIGDVVTTSGLSDIFPSGIHIGTISSIEMDTFGISKKAYVESDSNLEDLRFVSVLRREVK